MNSSEFKATVLAAVEKSSVYTRHSGEEMYSPQSATAIALLAAESVGSKLPPTQIYQSESSRLSGTGFGVSRVKKALRELVGEGAIREIDGAQLKPYSFFGGINEKGTYYLSHKSSELFAVEKKRRDNHARRSSAERQAREIVMARHRDEYASLVLEILSGGTPK